MNSDSTPTGPGASQAFRDLVLVVLCAIAIYVAVVFLPTEPAMKSLANHAGTCAIGLCSAVKDGSIIVLMFLPLALAIFSLRRRRELSLEIAKRKQAEEALRDSEERYRTLVERIPAITYIEALDVGTEADHTLIYVSPQVEEILGYSPEEWLANPGLWERLIHPDDREHVLSEDARVEKTGEPFKIEYRIFAKDNSLVWIRDEAVLMRDEEGRPLFWQGVQIDITEQKRAEEALRSSEEFFRALYEDVHHPIFLLDEDLNFVDVNPYACAFYGYSHEEFKRMKVWDITLPEERDKQLRNVRRIRERGNIFVAERRHRKKNGEVVTVTADSARVTRSGQELYVSKITDITERKEAEEALLRSEAGLAEAQRMAHLGNWEWEVRTGEVWWSDEVFRTYGFEPQEFTPDLERLMEIVHPDDRQLLEEKIDGALYSGEPYDFEHRVIRPDGEVRVLHRRAEVVRSEGGEPLRMIGTVHDITERKALEEQLEHLAYHDPLTDIPNRTLLMDCLEQALARAQREGGEVAALLVDLDDFKVINDSLGHEAGDKVLVSVSQRLRMLVRPRDTIARFGGDEFAVVLEETDAEDASRVAQRIIERMRTFFAVDGSELTATCSVGIALGGGAGVQPTDLLRRADIALYEAKARGKNRHEAFEEAMEAYALERLETEHLLRQATAREEGLVVHYQPVVSLEEGGRIVGFEALVRWNHPWRGLVLPAEFLHLAEQTGTIVGIGRWVLRETCRQAREWHERYPSDPPLTVSVNLSATQLAYPGLVEDVAQTLESSGLEPRDLILEVTECAMMGDVYTSAAILGQLKDLGVRIAVDDFGKDYSSLSYLKHLPVDILKIDRAFIAGLGTDEKDEGIVRAMIELARTLDLEVTAEGVETGEQLAHLREVECKLAQGYYFWKPLPAERAGELLATYNYRQ